MYSQFPNKRDHQFVYSFQVCIILTSRRAFCASCVFCTVNKLLKGELNSGRGGSSGCAQSVQIHLVIHIVYCVEVLA